MEDVSIEVDEIDQIDEEEVYSDEDDADEALEGEIEITEKANLDEDEILRQVIAAENLGGDLNPFNDSSYHGIKWNTKTGDIEKPKEEIKRIVKKKSKQQDHQKNFRWTPPGKEEEKETNSTPISQKKSEKNKKETEKDSDSVPYLPNQVGLVYVWGKGIDGQLGIAKAKDIASPTPIPSFSNGIRRVSCGQAHSIAIADNGDSYSWGSNPMGQLGTDAGSQPTPTMIPKLSGYNIRTIDCGEAHSVCLSDAGKVFCFGSGHSGQLGIVGVTTQRYPRLLKSLYDYNVVQVACGAKFTAILTDLGRLYTFGENASGQLGLGDLVSQEKPLFVQALQDKMVMKVACGSEHTAVILDNGSVWTFGKGRSGQLGHGVATTKNSLLVYPTKIESFTKRAINIALGSEHSLILSEEGTIYSCGSGKEGQHGLGHKKDVSTPTAISCDKTFIDISSGSKHCAAITDSGQLFTWGNGHAFKLGHGVVTDEYSPRLITALHDVCVNFVACGVNHTIAIVDRLSPISRDLKQLLNNSKYSDVTITTSDDRKLSAHKIILYSRSTYFRDILSKDSSIQDIAIPLSYEIVFLVLEYLYTDDSHPTHDQISPLSDAAKELQLTRLQQICECLRNKRNTTDKPSLVSDIKKAFNLGMFSDCKFAIEGKFISAHKCILSSRSSYFKMMFTWNDRFSGKSLEAPVQEIEIPDFKYELIESIISYIYSSQIDIHADNVLEMFMVSNRYRLTTVKQLCEDYIQSSLDLSNACSILLLAQLYDSNMLKRLCLDIIVKNLEEAKKQKEFNDLTPELKREIEVRIGGTSQSKTKVSSSSASYLLDQGEVENGATKIPRELSAAIAKARNAKGYTRGDLARFISEKPSLVADYENGKCAASKRVIIKIEKVLHTKLLHLMEDEQ